MSVFILDALLKLNSSQYNKDLEMAAKNGRAFAETLRGELDSVEVKSGQLGKNLEKSLDGAENKGDDLGETLTEALEDAEKESKELGKELTGELEDSEKKGDELSEDLKDGLDEAGKEGKKVGKHIKEGLSDAEKKSNAFIEGLKKGLSQAVSVIGKLSVAAVGAATTGLTVLTKQAVDAYSNFEQLEGGTELLFGEAFGFVMEQSKKAYSTVQMSQNEYLQQVNGFATGLKTALGGNEQAAAELADRIITAEADIVSATGVSQEAVQNAFNGIMKSNFSMIDNLQLGITPTKEGFQEMIDSVNAYNAAHGNMTKYTIDNLADCQNALLDYVEMQGLSGYAQAEASGTIQGSLAMVKASWSDLLSGLANPDADLGQLMSNLVQSASTALHNLVPVISQTVKNVGVALKELAPVISGEIIPLIKELLPQLIETATILVDGLVEALPEIINSLLPILPELLTTVINSIITILPMLIEVGASAIGILGQALVDNMPIIIPKLVQLISDITMQLTAPNNLAAFVNVAFQLISTMALAVVQNIPFIVDAFMQMCINIGVALYENWDSIVSGTNEFLQTLTDSILDGFFSWLGISQEQLGQMVIAFEEYWKNAFNSAGEGLSNLKNKFKEGWNNITTGLKNFGNNAKEAFKNAIMFLPNLAGEGLEKVKSKFTSIFDKIKAVVDKAVGWLKGAFKFDWKLPEIKLPHITVKGGKAPYGIAGQGTLPSFDIKWYKKAYDDAYIMNGPTIFGAQGGKLLAGGEGNGSETIVGTELLMNMVGTVVRNELEGLTLPVYLDGDKMVGYIAPRLDTELGRLTNMSLKGAY